MVFRDHKIRDCGFARVQVTDRHLDIFEVIL